MTNFSHLHIHFGHPHLPPTMPTTISLLIKNVYFQLSNFSCFRSIGQTAHLESPTAVQVSQSPKDKKIKITHTFFYRNIEIFVPVFFLHARILGVSLTRPSPPNSFQLHHFPLSPISSSLSLSLLIYFRHSFSLS